MNRTAASVGLALIIGALLGSALTLATVRSASRPGQEVIPAPEFHPIPRVAGQLREPDQSIPVDLPAPTPTPIPPASASPVASAPITTRRAEPVKPRTSTPPGHRLSGVRMTWYCEPGRSRCTKGYPASGAYVAVSPELLHLRGRVITICYRGECVRARVIDCNCQARRAIDVYASVFRRFAPLSRGALEVSISW